MVRIRFPPAQSPRTIGPSRVGKIAHAHIATLLEFVEIGDEGIGLHDVGRSRTRSITPGSQAGVSRALAMIRAGFASMRRSVGMDRHLADVGMTRHREAATLYAGRDDFRDKSGGRDIDR